LLARPWVRNYSARVRKLTSALNTLLLLGLLGGGAWWFIQHNHLEDGWRERRTTSDGLGTRLPGRHSEEQLAPQGRGDITAPRTQPGERLDIELVEVPNSHYGKARWTEADEMYAGLARSVAGVTYDPLLGHAARELAAFYALERQMAPSGGLQFILDSAGAPEWDVLRTMLVTTDTGLDALRGRIEKLAKEASEPIKIGIGESYPASPPLRRYLAILVSTSPLKLNPVARQSPTGEPITLSGRLPRDLGNLRAVMLRPDGTWDTVKAHRGADASFVATLDPGEEAGVLSVELIADRRTGPHPLAQLELSVGVPVPTRFEGNWPPDESEVVTVADAERLALQLLNADRARGGLKGLKRDPALDLVARSHSRDMRDNRFTGHTSPSTGTLGDRLKRASYSALFRAENIATNQSLHDAQSGLLASLAHRRNILAKDATHVGIGVAIKPVGDKDIYYLTQVFTKPARRIDLAQGLFDVKKRLSAARKQKGLTSLRWDPDLARVANRIARSRKPTPSKALDAAKNIATRGAAASVSTLGDLGTLDIPKLATDRRYRRLGVGVYQRASKPGEVPTIVVVIIAAG